MKIVFVRKEGRRWVVECSDPQHGYCEFVALNLPAAMALAIRNGARV